MISHDTFLLLCGVFFSQLVSLVLLPNNTLFWRSVKAFMVYLSAVVGLILILAVVLGWVGN